MHSTQRCFLHKPVRNFDAIKACLNDKTSESEQHDFKRQVWGDKPEKPQAIPWDKKKTVEAAKDVAAFANHLGGDIIIGIKDSHDRANDLFLMSDVEAIEVVRNIPQWLMTHLKPASFATLVEIEAIASPDGKGFAVVVSVPPSADLIAVEYREKNSDKYFYQFPVRLGRRTRWLT